MAVATDVTKTGTNAQQATAAKGPGPTWALSCDRAALHNALGVVIRAVGGRTTLPILDNVLLEADAEQDKLRLSATDLDVGITTQVGATVKQSGQYTVPVRLLSEFVGALSNSEGPVQITGDGRGVEVRCARAKATLKGIDAEEFPPFPSGGSPLVTSAANVLHDALGRVSCCAAKDFSRPVLSGVALRVDYTAGTCTVQAADGFRMARCTVSYGTGREGMPEQEVIVPLRGVKELLRLLGEAGETPVTLSITENKNQLLCRIRDGESGAVLLVARLLEGQFPDLQRVIPQTQTTRLVVNRKALLAAVKVARLFVRGAADLVRLEIPAEAEVGEEGSEETAERAVLVRSVSAEVGDQQGTLEGALVTGEAITVALGGGYLVEMLAVLPGEEVMLDFNGPMSPITLRGVSLDGYVGVVMPMSQV